MQAWRSAKQAFDPAQDLAAKFAAAQHGHHFSPAARRYYFTGPLVDVAEQLIRSNVKAASSQLTFKMAGNTIPLRLASGQRLRPAGSWQSNRLLKLQGICTGYRLQDPI